MTVDENNDPFPSSSRIIVDKDADCERLGIKKPLFICAPMVRYSKLPFRKLVRLYGCDLTYTPMIYADDFLASDKARDAEFSTDDIDGPNTILQFASNRPEIFADAAEMVYGQVKGVDLNCGCPKSDVRSLGVGSKLLESPEIIADIVKQTRARISDPDFNVSVKIRIKYPIEISVDMCRKFEAAGVDHIAVHGRTVAQRKETPDYEAIRLIKSSLSIPVYANGGVTSYQQALEVASTTGVDGIMVAEGLLDNPALFAGHSTTPPICIKDWFDIYEEVGMTSTLFQRHLAFMSRRLLNKKQRTDVSQIANPADLISHFTTLLDL